MSDSAFIDALGHERARWLDGDPDAWAIYSASCLRLEAEMRSASSEDAPAKKCTCSRKACCSSQKQSSSGE